MLSEKFIPQTIAEVTARVKQQFVDAEAVGLIDKATLEAKLDEADAWERKSHKEPPAEVRTTIQMPWPFKWWPFAIHNMHWRVLKAGGPSYFLNHDNPHPRGVRPLLRGVRVDPPALHALRGCTVRGNL